MELNDRQKELILKLAECNMRVTETARATYQHRNNACYHIAQIKKKVGLDPLNFYDLCKLVEIVKEETNETMQAQQRD